MASKARTSPIDRPAFNNPEFQKKFASNSSGVAHPAVRKREEAAEKAYQLVREYTMVPKESIKFTMGLAARACDLDLAGDIVECGVWKGGCSFGMVLFQKLIYGRVIKPVWMFDSFEGLPVPTEQDGKAAFDYHANPDHPEYHDNLAIDVEHVRETSRRLGLVEGSDFHLVKGWFSDTVPPLVDTLGKTEISLLRLDGDWYDSTMTCLRSLCPLVTDEGVVVLDDYFSWDGCAHAVHEYLTEINMPYRIRSPGDNLYYAYFIKRPIEASQKIWTMS